MGSLSELADSLTPNVPARMTNLGANSDNLLVDRGLIEPDGHYARPLVNAFSLDAHRRGGRQFKFWRRFAVKANVTVRSPGGAGLVAHATVSATP
ncbi:hypothetical protein GNZ13_35065 [Paraburkholderia sp. 5N]|uniref:Uncharacterized protein n=2 Tax=Paraburkholderia elongata TaxID=2675747 RepID=A0A972NTN2_9BURK|nr:hypothetical protein [Paraburkholderia elongata]